MKLASRPLGTKVRYIPTDRILPNPNQPRKVFADDALRSLAASIRENGVLQPLSVRREAGEWQLVAGERRLRAAKMAGLAKVPCVEVDADGEKSSLYALVENLQRRDLDFLDEAQGIRRLIDEHRLSQEEAARRLGLSQSAVANKLRVLKVEPEVLAALRDAGCGERHARALLALGSDELRREAAARVIIGKLTVADTEALVAGIMSGDIRLADIAAEGVSTSDAVNGGAPSLRSGAKPKKRRKFIIKDVRIFLNTVREAVKLMKSAGVNAQVGEEEQEGELVITIRVPSGPRAK